MKGPNTFPKAEHLCLQRAIDELFDSPTATATAWPVRALWREAEGDCTQVLMSVAKRRLHHAVDRNRAKRQLREAYRLQKQMLNADTRHWHIALVWMANEPQSSERVHAAVGKILHAISQCSPES